MSLLSDTGRKTSRSLNGTTSYTEIDGAAATMRTLGASSASATNRDNAYPESNNKTNNNNDDGAYSVDSVMSRWRVRPVYDSYATATVAAPDTMTSFLELRAELLKSSLPPEALGEVSPAAVAAQEAANRFAYQQHQQQQNGMGGPFGATPTGLGSTYSGTVGSLNTAVFGGAGGGNSMAGSPTNNNPGANSSGGPRDEYTVRYLSAELSRLLEMLQQGNAENVQLKAQVAGQGKELVARQRKLGDLEEANRALGDENRQLLGTVEQLKQVIGTIENSHQVQLGNTFSGTLSNAAGTTTNLNLGATGSGGGPTITRARSGTSLPLQQQQEQRTGSGMFLSLPGGGGNGGAAQGAVHRKGSHMGSNNNTNQGPLTPRDRKVSLPPQGRARTATAAPQ